MSLTGMNVPDATEHLILTEELNYLRIPDLRTKENK
jgi:hypothetical protein